MSFSQFDSVTRALAVSALAVVCMSTVGCDQPKGADSGPSSSDNGGKPQIVVVGGDTVNWGDVAPAKLTRTVRIANAGGDTLRIADVHPSCGCTTAPLDKKMLGPGDTATVELTMDVSSSPTGQAQKTLTITSNDSTRPSVVVQLIANVQHDLVAVPAAFPIAEGSQPGKESSTELSVTNSSSAPVTIQPPVILEASEMAVRFDQREPKTIAPGDSMKLVAYVTPVRVGVYSTDVVLRSSSTKQPEMKLRLTVNAQEKN